MYWQRPDGTSIVKPLFAGTVKLDPALYVRTSEEPSRETRHEPSTISISSDASVPKWNEPGRMRPRVFFAPSGMRSVWLTTFPSK